MDMHVHLMIIGHADYDHWDRVYRDKWATFWPAKLLKHDDWGTVAPGKLADIIVVDGDPLRSMESLRHVVHVIKDGRVYK